MLRKIDIKQLTVGMYVERVDKDWFNIPFFRKKISSSDQIEKLRSYHVHEVHIDTDRGVDIDGREPRKPLAVAVDTRAERLQLERPWLEPQPNRSVVSPEFLEEIGRAREVHTQAISAVRQIMSDTRSGRYLHEETTQSIVSEMVESCMRNDDALISLAKLLSFDEYTFSHCVNTTVFALALGKSLGMTTGELQRLGESVMLHDVGKMMVPPEILNKPGKLTPEEFEEMKLHVRRGVDFLRESFPGRQDRSIVALEHHERVDGSGYPEGKSGDEISQWGQISAIADVYDALTSRRCYKRELTPHRAIALIFRLRGGDFNPLFVDKFVECVGIYPIGSLVRLNTGEIGLIVSVRHEELLRPDVLILYRNSSRLRRPKLVDLSERNGNGEHVRTVEDILDPEVYGVNPAAHITEV